MHIDKVVRVYLGIFVRKNYEQIDINFFTLQ